MPVRCVRIKIHIFSSSLFYYLDRGGLNALVSLILVVATIVSKRTVLEVYNQQRSVLGFRNQKSGLGVFWAVPMDFPPSKVPDTTLVPCQMARMVAGNCHSHVSMGLNCQQSYPPPLGPPERLKSRLNIFRL